MFQYESHQLRSAELIRRANHERLVNEAVRARKSAAGASDTKQPQRHWFTRAA
ncbi:hypothetical protein ACSCBZ_05940 [Streptomyces niveiscabiei]|uniref:hypothetical protein n=1 Tax=Streptomyces TaxID=1883 RepID=UPI000AB48EA8|nr:MULTISPECIES: hypothetical protein [Streptomyces]